MDIKKELAYWCIAAFIFGLVAVLFGLQAAATDKWYKEVTSTPRYRAMIVDHLAENTVTIYDITGSGKDAKIRVTNEP